MSTLFSILFDNPFFHMVRKHLVAVLALIATLVVVVVIVMFSIYREMQPVAIPSGKFEWTTTTYAGSAQTFAKPVDGENVSYKDAGFVSGTKEFYVGMSVNSDLLELIDVKDNVRYQMEIPGSGLEFELYRDGIGGYWIQSMRCCNQLVPTTRGLYVGMPLEELLRVLPASSSTRRDGKNLILIADDTLIEFKINSRDLVTEIRMRFA